MNTIKCAMVSVLVATTASAENPQLEIEARYEGFDPSFFAEVQTDSRKSLPEGALALPRVTTKAGQTAVIEVIREVELPVTGEGKMPEKTRVRYHATKTAADGTTTVDDRKTANCGASLEVLPDIKDGRITLTGKSTVRHLMQPGVKQPLTAVSFTSRETFFSGEVSNGQAVIIQVGDGLDDKAKITLTVRLIGPDGTPIK